MASAPKAGLPISYNDLVPLNTQQHASWKAIQVDKAPWVASQHVVPLTVEEFPMAQRDFPIVFSTGDNPVPLAVMGLNEGVNTYFEPDGTLIGTPYIPAYIRRYPFLLVKMRQDDENLSLCFDPTSGLLGDFEDGVALFEADQTPSAHTKELLNFCEKFEEAGMRTKAFMDELKNLDLLMDGEVAINRMDGQGQPFVYRGFKMVDEKKLRELRGDQLRKMVESGLLGLIYAHMMSLDLLRVVFARADAQGRGPAIAAA
jgi:hypothetical protein